MSAQKIPIEFIPINTSTEHGEGVLIHWTSQPRLTGGKHVVLCASIESTRTKPGKRMEKYLRNGGR